MSNGLEAIVAGRVRTEHERRCDACGADCSFFLEEDDTHERMDGGAKPESIPNRGLYLKDDVLYCLNCDTQYA